jgi:uncharacterized protein
MTPKRLLLAALTLFAILMTGADLISSWQKPQFNNRLELYEADLRLHTLEYQDKSAQQIEQMLAQSKPAEGALTQYQDARDKAGKAIARSLSDLGKQKQAAAKSASTETAAVPTAEGAVVNEDGTIDSLEKVVEKQQKNIDGLDLRIGLLQAYLKKPDEARKTWSGLVEKDHVYAASATALTRLWSPSPKSISAAAAQTEAAALKKDLDGWFRYQALSQLYSVQGQADEVKKLQAAELPIAQKAVFKLGATGLISTTVVLGGLGMLIFLLGQRVLRGSGALLSSPSLGWAVPWDWETIWFVLVVGFFAVGQLIAPVLFGAAQSALNLTPDKLGERGQAFYILGSYIFLAGGGLGVLYATLKSFLPLPEGWFRLNWRSNWVLWGVGGYLAAFPLVIAVNLANQQIWQGQGGSNPILPIALAGKDPIALGIFFFTAAIAAPLFEETLFRGFLLPSLTRYLPSWGAICLSGLIFAVVHLSLSEVLPLTMLGIVLGFVYAKTRNLLASMLLHSLWNTGTLVSLFLIGGAGN